MMNLRYIDVIARTSILKLVRGNPMSKMGLAASAFTLKVLLVGLLAMTAIPAHAAFEDTGTGARPTVMGGTYVAVGDDVLSLMYNPATLAKLHTHEISSEYSRLYTGLTDGSKLGQYFMGYGQPIKYGGTLAVGWKQFNLDDLYSERTLSLGYGEWITNRVAAGFALKQLYHSFGAPSISVDDNGNVTNSAPTFFQQNGNSASAYSVDLGLLVRYTPRTTIGLSIQDVNEPNVALNPNDHEIVARTVRLGVSHQHRNGVLLAGSLTTHEGLSNQMDKTWTGAAEKWWTMKDKTAIAARGSLASGSRSFSQMAAGAGYRFGSYQLDYAFVFNMSGITLGDTSGTHRFSLSYRFGPDYSKVAAKKATAKPAVKSKPKIRRVQELPKVELPAPDELDAPPQAKKTSVRAVQEITLEEIGEEREVRENAQMMGETPLPTPPPSHAGVTPAALPQQIRTVDVEDVETTPVDAPDLEVPVSVPQSPQWVEAISREDLLSQTLNMVNDYTRRTARRVSAEDRLGAYTPLYPALKGYGLTTGELSDDLEGANPIDQSEQQYEAMKWDGASAGARLQHLAKALETSLIPALRNRQWDMNDLRDRRYKAWLEQAIAKGRQLIASGTAPATRMHYWAQVSAKALEFEEMPSMPIPTPAPVVIPVKPVPAVAIPAVPEVPETPAVQPKKAPVETLQAVPTGKAAEQAIGRPLGDGEWLYKVQEGDTLLSLANRFYRDYNRWRDIYILNEDRLGRGGNLRPGQLLLMPKRGEVK